MQNERYNPVPHDAAFVAELLADPATKQAYDALEEEYAALNAVLRARREAGLTQAQIAERMGTTVSAVSRLESSLVNQKHSPSFATLKKYAHACGKKLVVSLA
jgi:ribosome-binding protein aMBF1 (putative translation factor)